MKCEEQQEYVSSSACSHAATAVQLYMCGVCVCVCVCVCACVCVRVRVCDYVVEVVSVCSSGECG